MTGMARCAHALAETPIGRLSHEPNERLLRHRHRFGFITLVLKGRYTEAGDEGRLVAQPGDVLVHQAFDNHLDEVSPRGAEVLVLPLPNGLDLPAYGEVADVDAIARLAERNLEEVAVLIAHEASPRAGEAQDWPDLLAAQLRLRPSTVLSVWAEEMGLRPETVSRGFPRVFGATPARYRSALMASRAARAVLATDAPLVEIALDCGFSDQSHMTRAVVGLTGVPPSVWRARASRQRG